MFCLNRPFSVVDMKEMAKALNIESPELESELVDLIDKNVLPFRVDSVQSLLVLKKTDESLLAYTDALKASDDFLSTARSALLNQSLLTHNIVIADGDTISHIPTCGVNSEKPQKGALISSISSLI